MAAAKTTSTEVQSSIMNVVNMIVGRQEFQDLLVIYSDFHHITTISGVDKEWFQNENTSSELQLCGGKGLGDARGQRSEWVVWDSILVENVLSRFQAHSCKIPNIVGYLSMNE